MIKCRLALDLFPVITIMCGLFLDDTIILVKTVGNQLFITSTSRTEHEHFFCCAFEKAVKRSVTIDKETVLCGLPSSTLVCNAHSISMSNRVNKEARQRCSCTALTIFLWCLLFGNARTTGFGVFSIVVLKNSCAEY